MTDEAYPDALPPHHRLHWYVLERVLGQGGFGITYLARDTNLDQLVAIKEYLPGEVAARRPDHTVRARTDAQRERYRWGLERFIQEARTLARFDHPNIVRVHSVFELNDTAYMVMRFEAGDNLGALLERRGVLPENELLRILLPILDGLELVHGAGFIHRDIKPDNIHIRDDGTPVLLDFGSARNALGKARTLTILIAPGYAPFEQYYSSAESQGPWTDIYGLGATCYRAIAGTPPLDSIARSKGILGSTREVLVAASVIGKGRYSDGLLAAVDHALAFAEKDRPQTVAEWRRELAATDAAPMTREAAADSRNDVAVKPAPPAAPVGPATVKPAVGATPSAGTRAPMLWAAFGAIAGAIAIAIFLRVSHTDDAKPVAPSDINKAPITQPAKSQPPATADAQPAAAPDVASAQQPPAAGPPESKPPATRTTGATAPKSAAKPKPSLPAAKPPAKPEPATAPATPAAAPEPSAPPVVAVVAPAVAPPARPAAAESKPSAQDEQLARGEAALERGDYAAAFQVLKPLADAGNARAQFKVAAMYASGQGVKLNNSQAYIWYSLAARAGNTAASAERSRIALLLQPAEVRQADELVKRTPVR